MKDANVRRLVAMAKQRPLTHEQRRSRRKLRQVKVKPKPLPAYASGVLFDWRIVKVEQKGMCAEEWVEEKKIATCGFFYLYDANRHVHICSFTPSQELFPLTPYVTFTEEPPEDEYGGQPLYDEVEDELQQAEEPCCYMDASDVRRLPSQPAGWSVDREDDEDDETYYMRAVQEMTEYYRGNHVWF